MDVQAYAAEFRELCRIYYFGSNEQARFKPRASEKRAAAAEEAAIGNASGVSADKAAAMARKFVVFQIVTRGQDSVRVSHTHRQTHRETESDANTHKQACMQAKHPPPPLLCVPRTG
jgi:hypothetical protein